MIITFPEEHSSFGVFFPWKLIESDIQLQNPKPKTKTKLNIVFFKNRKIYQRA